MYYDVVQFIYPHIFNRLVNSYFIEQLMKQNKSSFLVAAGSDAFYWMMNEAVNAGVDAVC